MTTCWLSAVASDCKVWATWARVWVGRLMMPVVSSTSARVVPAVMSSARAANRPTRMDVPLCILSLLMSFWLLPKRGWNPDDEPPVGDKGAS